MDDKKRAMEAIERIKACIENDKCEITDCAYFNMLGTLQELIQYLDKLGAIIHCNECRYYVCDIDGTNKHCTLWGLTMQSDFYCASAERKESNGVIDWNETKFKG